MVGGAATENGGMGIGYMTEGLDPELGGPGRDGLADNKLELERGWITTVRHPGRAGRQHLLCSANGTTKMDAEKLKASVARWNELRADKGADEDFGPPAAGKGRDLGRSTPFRCTRASAIPSAVLAATRTPTSSIRAATRFLRLYSAGLVRQHEWPHLRHHRRQWLRELVRRPVASPAAMPPPANPGMPRPRPEARACAPMSTKGPALERRALFLNERGRRGSVGSTRVFRSL